MKIIETNNTELSMVWGCWSSFRKFQQFDEFRIFAFVRFKGVNSSVRRTTKLSPLKYSEWPKVNDEYRTLLTEFE